MDLTTLFLELNCNNENTKTAYRTDITQMLDCIGKNIEDIDEMDIVNYKNSIKHLSSATQHRKIIVVKEFFEFLAKNNKIAYNPTELVKNVRVVNKEEDTLTTEQVKAIINASKNPRDKAIMSVFANTGIRVSELCSIKLNDIDENHNVSIVGKRDKRRLIHLNDKVYGAISDYLKVRKDGCDRLFTSNNGTPMSPRSLAHTVKVLGNKAGVNGVHCHSLRHYYATSLLDNNVPISQIALTMGHNSVSTTERYAKVRDAQGVTEMLMNMELV